MKTLKRFIALSLIVAALAAVPQSGLAEEAPPAAETPPEGAAEILEKNEVVYARLSGAGQTESVYVVNNFTLSGSGGFSDYGEYSRVVNLTDLWPLEQSGGEVRARTSSGNYFYQGDLASTNLPWVYRVEYSLDGASVTPQELAGKSGALKIRVFSERNAAINETFYNNYMQQITLTLDTDKAANITAAGAANAGAGKSRVLVFTVLPKSDADITVTADVKDFEMAGVEIAAMPFSMGFEMPDLGASLGDFTALSDAIGALNDGMVSLSDGAAEFGGGLAALDQGSASLSDASAQINGALAHIASSAAQIEAMAADNPTLAAALGQLTGGLGQLSASYSEFQGGLDAYTSGVSGLAQGYGEISAGMAQLREGTNRLAQETADMPGLINDQIGDLIVGFTGGDFTPVSFTSDRNAKIGFVQFVFSAQGVEKPAPQDTAQPEADTANFFDRLVNLFK
ncbi:MAG: hypothetical protein LBR85_00365 [Oscillospiraceae bacterium]|jgi:hypothetical protein|nr:hypothetical protein [Oscillospiraceae bacterium]